MFFYILLMPFFQYIYIHLWTTQIQTWSFIFSFKSLSPLSLSLSLYIYIYIVNRWKYSPVGWGCRIHRLHFSKGVRPPTNKCPGYVTKQSDGEVPMISLPSLPGPLMPGMEAPDRALSMGEIELNCILMLNWIVWIRTVFVCYIELFEKELFLILTLYLC